MSTMPAWNRRLAAYAMPDHRRSYGQLALTLGIFAGLVAAAHALLGASFLLALPLSAAAGLFLVRLFIIQHDCGHASFLRSKAACDWIGRALSVLTLTPYAFWRKDHDKHHATAGSLSRRGIGDIDTLTVSEYMAKGRWGRVAYRLYRNPVVLFGIGPSWQFLVRNRLPLWLKGKSASQARRSILLTNVAAAAFFGTLGALLGFGAVAAVWLPAIVTAATVGIWLFYVQHQFEDTYWEHDGDWSYVDAALKGCSFYRLPGWLHWVTGWIGFHHIHHLSAKIPNYNLKRAFDDIPELRDARSIGIRASLRCARLALWCEETKRLVSFRQAHARLAAA